MVSLPLVRKICAAIDAVSVTIIAAGLSKTRAKSEFAAFACESNCAEDFPSIAACKAAAILKSRTSTRSQSAVDNSPISCSRSGPTSEPPPLVKIKAEKDPEKLFLLFKSNAHNRLVVENRFAFQDTVSRLAGARRFDLIEELLEQQKALPQGRREGFVIRIIMLYGKAGMAEHAVKTFQEMCLFGCPRTVKSFNATLKVLSENKRIDYVLTFFSEASDKYGVVLDEISYNIIIKFLCETGNLESAYLVMAEMEKVGLKPDVVTYTTIISACYKHNRREIGDGLWNLMLIRGCLPNLATFNARIQFLINRSRAWQANDLARGMCKFGIQPDEVTYNLIIKGFCMMGELEMAKRVFDSLHGRGCKPNAKIYQTIVHYLCEEGEFDRAFRLCKDSMEKNWFPSIDTITKLLKGLMAISKDRNAREIMKLVSERTPCYSAVEMNIFHDILSQGRGRKKQ